MESEVKLRSKLENALSLLGIGDAEVGIRLGDDLGNRILLKLQRQVVAAGQRPQRTVEEVVGLRTDSSFILSLMAKFLKIERSESKNAGP